MQYLYVLVLLALVTGCSTIQRQSAFNSGAGVVEVFVVAFDNVLGCPLDAAKALSVNQPEGECRQGDLDAYIRR